MAIHSPSVRTSVSNVTFGAIHSHWPPGSKTMSKFNNHNESVFQVRESETSHCRFNWNNSRSYFVQMWIRWPFTVHRLLIQAVTNARPEINTANHSMWNKSTLKVNEAADFMITFLWFLTQLFLFFVSISDSSSTGVYVPEGCTDNQFFAKCELIVKGHFCTHKYYAKFCCRSCTLAGQLTSYSIDTNLLTK